MQGKKTCRRQALICSTGAPHKNTNNFLPQASQNGATCNCAT